MFASKLSSIASVALVATLAFGALDGASAQTTTCTLRRGLGQGSWDLPTTSAGQGAFAGLFLIPNNPTFGMQFIGTLTDIPSPCLSCIGGTLHGTLDDGIGPGPDYDVVGTYSGLWLSGSGVWTAQIHSLHTPQPTLVGRVGGTFHDPPVNGGPGTFACRWKICD